MPRKKQNKFQRKIDKFLKVFSPRSIQILKVIGITVVTIALMILVYFGEQAGMWFKASVLETPQPFNGTVMPVSKVPKWSYWNTQKYLTYNQISPEDLIDLPPYDLSVMAFPNKQLEWGNPNHDKIRSTKIAYPVVYMGNYEYDHAENVGSHLAVDIKMPVGTPVHSIANGKVVKRAIQNTGFGNHVVIKHLNVPDPENPGKLTTLYSAFNHMSDIDVVEGQNVLKGEIIGRSGNSGTSTTPHLHFQIDRETAPWHPYWPFSWAESQQAGLSFFEAVNAGLGLSKGKSNTVHPMKFLTANIGYSSVASTSGSGTQDPSPVEDPIEDTVEDPTEDPVEDPVEVAVVTPDPDPESTPDQSPAQGSGEVEIIENPFDNSNTSSLFSYDIVGESVSLINNGVTLTVVDEGNQLRKLNEDDPIDVAVSGVGKVLKNSYKRADFNNNAIKVVIRSSEPGVSNVMIGKSSFQINFIEKVNGVAKFHFDHDGRFQESIVETVRLVALDADENLAPAVNFSGVVNISVEQGSARVIPDQVLARDFRNGIVELRVIASKEEPVVLRAQNGALVGTSERLTAESKEVFADISIRDPNYEAIKYLKDNGIVSGYSDGEFKPNNTVNRVEALKMLMLAFSVQAGSDIQLSFNDVNSDAWYVGTLKAAVSRGIVKGYNDGSFKPGNTVNRAEYLKMLFATNSITSQTVIAKPYDDVETGAWFAGYAFMANKMNLLSPADNFNPGNAMTRAGVAKTIYRMKMIQENNWVTYSK